VLLGSITRDAQTYFNLNGISLGVGKTAAADLEQPNPLGGEPLPATFRITIESATNVSVVGTTTTTYDTAPLMRAARALAE
jgi:hypothetical protein